DRVQLRDLSVLTRKTLGHHAPFSRTSFFMRMRRTEHGRPERPRGLGSAFLRGLGQKLELPEFFDSLAVRGTEAIGSRVSSADHHPPLVFLKNPSTGIDIVTGHGFILLRQIIERRINSAELAAGDRKFARLHRATRKTNRVELVEK